MTQPEPVTKFALHHKLRQFWHIRTTPEHAEFIGRISGVRRIDWWEARQCYIILCDPRRSPADIEQAIKKAWEDAEEWQRAKADPTKP